MCSSTWTWSSKHMNNSYTYKSNKNIWLWHLMPKSFHPGRLLGLTPKLKVNPEVCSVLGEKAACTNPPPHPLDPWIPSHRYTSPVLPVLFGSLVHTNLGCCISVTREACLVKKTATADESNPDREILTKSSLIVQHSAYTKVSKLPAATAPGSLLTRVSFHKKLGRLYDWRCWLMSKSQNKTKSVKQTVHTCCQTLSFSSSSTSLLP